MPSHIRKIMNHIRNAMPRKLLQKEEYKNQEMEKPTTYMTKQNMGLVLLFIIVILAIAYYWAMKNGKLPEWAKINQPKSQSQHLHYFFF